MAKQSITQMTTDVANHQSQPQKPTLSYTDLQTLFDKGAVDLKTYLNSTLNAELNGNDGQYKIGLSNGNLVSDNVGDAIEEVRQQVGDAVAGTIVDGSITNAKLNADVKVGSLGSLTTTEKASVVGAINELDSEATARDNAISTLSGQVTDNEISKTAWATTGTDNVQAVDLGGRFDASVTNLTFTIIPIASNTGAMTLNADSYGVKSVKKFDTVTDDYVDLEADDVVKNTPIAVTWLGTVTDFFVLAPKGSVRTFAYSGADVKLLYIDGDTDTDYLLRTADWVISGVTFEPTYVGVKVRCYRRYYADGKSDRRDDFYSIATYGMGLGATDFDLYSWGMDSSVYINNVTWNSSTDELTVEVGVNPYGTNNSDGWAYIYGVEAFAIK